MARCNKGKSLELGVQIQISFLCSNGRRTFCVLQHLHVPILLVCRCQKQYSSYGFTKTNIPFQSRIYVSPVIIVSKFNLRMKIRYKLDPCVSCKLGVFWARCCFREQFQQVVNNKHFFYNPTTLEKLFPNCLNRITNFFLLYFLWIKTRDKLDPCVSCKHGVFWAPCCFREHFQQVANNKRFDYNPTTFKKL